MSGKKQYHLDMSEWFRRRVRQTMVNLLLPSVLEAVGSRQDDAIQKDIDALREEQERTAALMAAFSDETRQREEATSQMLNDQVASLAEELRAEGAETRADLREAIAVQERSWRAELSRERDARWEQISALQADVRTLVEDRTQAEAAARRWLSDAHAVRALIDQTLPLDRDATAELTAHDKRLTTAAENIGAGLYEAAIATAQQSYHVLSDLRVELTLRHREWIGLRSRAATELTIVKELIDHGAYLPAAAFEEPEAAVEDIDVDHWSGGKLRELARRVDASVAAVDDAGQPPTIEQLREIIDERAPEYRGELDDILQLAQRRVEASQLRVNIAELVAAALEEGFHYQTSIGGYQLGDPREAFVARLDRLGGSVIVEVRPAGEDATATELDVLSYDDNTQSAELRQARAAAIAQYLRDRDFPVSDPLEVGEPDPALRELPQLQPAGQLSAAAPDPVFTAMRSSPAAAQSDGRPSQTSPGS